MQDLQHDDLLTEAAGMAPVSAWRKAAAAAGGSPRQHRRSVSREGSSSPRSHDSPGSLRQRVQLLWQMGRRALRATVVAVHLLQQQQQGGNAAARSSLPAGALPQQYVPGAGAAAHRREVLLHHLGVMLQDQASCLSPWFEPWRFRPQRTPLRLLTLQAAQVRGPPVRP